MGTGFERKLVAEFVGTFALIFMGAGSIIVFGGGQADIVAIALAHGLAIALMVSALGHVSGGVFNPAVAIGLWATRRLDTVTTIAYIAAQLVGPRRPLSPSRASSRTRSGKPPTGARRS